MIDGKSSLIVDVRPGDQLMIDGEAVSIELVKKSGQLARLRVIAPCGVKIEKKAPHAVCGDVASMA